MVLPRRLFVRSLGAAALWFPLLGPVRPATAQSAAYTYDELGRLIRVVNADGSTIEYSYDATGNRTSVVRTGTPPPQFSATIAIPAGGGVNLRTLVNNAGYDGARNASVTFTLAAGSTVQGSNGSGIAIDTGDWPTTTYLIALTLQLSGTVRGGGGNGGMGSGVPHALPGGAGGDAVYCRVPIAITVNSGGVVVGGGGGGGGGGGRMRALDPPFDRVGGGGGGGYPNGAAGAFGSPGQDGDSTGASNGTAGTLSGGGTGGSGETGGGGPGGSGGGQAGAGTTGGVGSGPGTGRNVGAGGAAGYAIRKNGHVVTVTNNGTITGAQS